MRNKLFILSFLTLSASAKLEWNLGLLGGVTGQTLDLTYEFIKGAEKVVEVTQRREKVMKLVQNRDPKEEFPEEISSNQISGKAMNFGFAPFVHLVVYSGKFAFGLSTSLSITKGPKVEYMSSAQYLAPYKASYKKIVENQKVQNDIVTHVIDDLMYKVNSANGKKAVKAIQEAFEEYKNPGKNNGALIVHHNLAPVALDVFNSVSPTQMIALEKPEQLILSKATQRIANSISVAEGMVKHHQEKLQDAHVIYREEQFIVKTDIVTFTIGPRFGYIFNEKFALFANIYYAGQMVSCAIVANNETKYGFTSTMGGIKPTIEAVYNIHERLAIFGGAGFTYLFKKDKEEKKGSYIRERSEEYCISDANVKENIQLYCGIYFKF